MGLAERLEKALAVRNLQIQTPKPKPTPEPEPEPELVTEQEESTSGPEEIQEEPQTINIPEKLKSDFSTLEEAIQDADSFEPDEFGTRLILVEKIDLEEIKLPLPSGKYTVDDIQKRQNGVYEVHLVENNQK